MVWSNKDKEVYECVLKPQFTFPRLITYRTLIPEYFPSLDTPENPSASDVSGTEDSPAKVAAATEDSPVKVAADAPVSEEAPQTSDGGADPAAKPS